VIYFFHGPDDFSIREAVQKQLKAALPADTADLNLTRLTGDQVTPDALRFACEAAPFLADRRAVVVDRFFSGKKTTHTDAVVDYLARVPENTLLIFVETEAPKAGPVARGMAAARAKVQLYGPLTGAALARWIRERVKARGGQVGDPAAQLLASFIGPDLRVLENEIGKLVAYAGPGKAVEPDHVRLLVNQATESNVFALVDAVALGQMRAALRALGVLIESGAAPIYLLGMLGRQIRLLIQARDAADRRLNGDETAKALGVSGFPLRKAQEQARAFTVERLDWMHRRALEADLAIKTGRQPAELAIELLVADLVRPS
jgi:DNA polymerase III subunit delta